MGMTRKEIWAAFDAEYALFRREKRRNNQFMFWLLLVPMAALDVGLLAGFCYVYVSLSR